MPSRPSLHGLRAGLSWHDVALFGLMLCTAGWLFGTAAYRSDDYLLLRQAEHTGDALGALSRWAGEHFAPRDDGAWPRFYRPVWHASFLVDAHLFGLRAGWSALLSWSLHCAVAWTAGAFVQRVTGRRPLARLVTLLALLPATALQAPFWIAARGTLLAAWFTLLALRVAVAERAGAWPRLLLVALFVSLAAGSNEAGVVAGPAVGVVALASGRGAAGPQRVRVAAVAVLASCAWVAWRRWILGCWIGGYQLSAESSTDGAQVLTTVAGGVGRVAGFGVVAPAAAVVLGGVVLAGLAAAGVVAWRRSDRRLAALFAAALVLLVAFLAPVAGARFAADTANGRYLYAASVGWAFAVAGGLLLLDGAGARRLRRAAVFAIVGLTLVRFAVAVVRYDGALATARTLATSVAALPAAPPTVLLDLPDRVDGFLVARNALPYLALPPFVAPPPPVVGHLTDEALASGDLLGLSRALPLMPGVRTLAWRGDERRLAPGGWPREIRWRGTLRRGADDVLRCAGLPVAVDDVGLERRLPVGDPCELRGELIGDGPAQALRVREVAAWTPRLTAPADPFAGTWTYEGRANDAVVLLCGAEACAVGLGKAGALGVARPTPVPVAAADAQGRAAFRLPPAAATARRVQVLVMRLLDVELGAVHVLR